MSYLYYSLYKFSLFTSARNDQPEHTANIVLAVILSFTLFAIINVLEYYNINFIQDFWSNKVLIIVIYASFILFGYLFFIRNEKYLLLKKKYDNETKKSRALNISLIFIYLILLVILTFGID